MTNFHDLPDNTEKPIKTIDAKFFLLAMFIIFVLAFICSHFLDQNMNNYIKGIIYGTTKFCYWRKTSVPHGSILTALYWNVFGNHGVTKNRAKHVLSLIKWNLSNLWKNILPFEFIVINRSSGEFDKYRELHNSITFRKQLLLDFINHEKSLK